MRSIALPVFLAILPAVPSSAEVAYVSPELSLPKRLKPGPVNFESNPLPIPMVGWAADAVTIQAHDGTLANRRSALGKAMDAEVELQMVDDFDQQVVDYAEGHSPFLRGSLGQIVVAADAVKRFGPNFEPVVFLLVSWSAGADGLAAREAKSPSALKGKSLVLQANGRQLDLLPEILRRAKFGASGLKMRFVGEATYHPAAALDGRCHDPTNALGQDGALAAALGLQRDFTKANLKPLISTRDATRVLADVYAVRADFLAKHRATVEGFARAQSEEQTRFAKQLKGPNIARTMAGVFLNDEALAAEFQEWAGQIEFPGPEGNRRFFASQFAALNRDLSGVLHQAKLISAPVTLHQAKIGF